MKNPTLLSGTVIVKPSLFNAVGSMHDNKAQRNLYLEVLAGTFPKNAQVVTGTVANFSGFGCGQNKDILADDSMMLLEFAQTIHINKETGEPVTYVDKNGITKISLNTSYTVLARLNALDYLNAKSMIGAKAVIDTDAKKVEAVEKVKEPAQEPAQEEPTPQS
tara:strand:+ start:207 stop:695 length:489 start_codon:yes stop_codon:yes gene_type:complete